MMATLTTSKKAKRASEFIYQPADFDPSKYPGIIADHPDAARWLLNTIYFKRVVRNYGIDEFVNLHSRLLGMVMGDINHVRPSGRRWSGAA